MDQYWPEHKVYLFGKITFAVGELENKALLRQGMRHYFPYEDKSRFEVAMYEYEQAGYFELKILDEAKPTRYMLTNVNRQKFREELFDYLESIRLPAEQRDTVWKAAIKQYRQGRGYRPIIKWRDLYGDSTRFDYHPPFWEFFFKPAMDELVEIKSLAYDNTVTSVIKDGALVDIPKEMLLFYTRPFVEFEVLDKKLQQKVSRPRSTVKYRVGIIVTKTGKLQLSFDSERLTLWNYKSETSNTYRSARALYGANGEPLNKKDLNLRPDSKTQLKGLVKNMRITGILEELFIRFGLDQNNRQTVLLEHHAMADEGQHERLLEHVKTLRTKS